VGLTPMAERPGSTSELGPVSTASGERWAGEHPNPAPRAVFGTSRSLGDRPNQRLLLEPPQPILMLPNRAANSRMNCTQASRPAS
jgi:hypothetical protein